MSILVMKFGGASVRNPENFSRIADIVAQRKKEYGRVVVVVSAMQGMTDALFRTAFAVHPNPPPRELDMLVSVGERVSISLLAMALAAKNTEAVSFTGSQSGIVTTGEHTEAKIVSVKPFRILEELSKGKVVIVAGFQGVSSEGEITTLGRGGSDTSAVAVAVALKAAGVEFLKDVDGIYSADPKLVPSAVRYPLLHYDEALEIIGKGAKVLHSRAVELAKKNSLILEVRSFVSVFSDKKLGTLVRSADREEKERGEPRYEIEFNE